MSLKRDTHEYEARKMMLAKRRLKQSSRWSNSSPKPDGKYIPAGPFKNTRG